MSCIKKKCSFSLVLILVLCFISCQEKDGSLPFGQSQIAEVDVRIVPPEELELPIVTILPEPEGIPIGAPTRHNQIERIPINIQEKKTAIELNEDVTLKPGHPNYPSTFPIHSKPKQANRPADYPSMSEWKKTSGNALQLLEQNGLPEINNNGLFQDKEGAIWGCSRWGGAWKYDGFQFSHFNEYTGLNDYSVVDMLFDSEGDIWFGMSTALAKFDGLNFTHYTGKNEISTNKPTKLIEDSLGNIWVGSIDGLYRLDKKQNTITHFTSENGLIQNEISSLLYDQNGRIWITYNKTGVSLLSVEKKDSRYAYRLKNYRSSGKAPFSNVQCIYQMQNGNIYVGAERAFIEIKAPSIASNDPIQVIQFVSEDFTKKHFTFAMTEDHLGRLWVGRNTNLACLEFDENQKPRYISYLSEKDGLTKNNISGILLDREKQLWLSHFDKGITKLDLTQKFRSVLKDYDIAGQVSGLFEDDSQNIWFSIWKQGIFCLKPSRNGIPEYILQYKFDMPFNESRINNMIQDNEGNIWISNLQYVSKMTFSDEGDPETIYHYKPSTAFNSKLIFDLMLDDAGAVWMAQNTLSIEDKHLLSTGGGVYKIDGQRLYYYGKDQGLLSSDTYNICQDQKGNFWFNSIYHGITKWEPDSNQGLGQWAHYTGNNVMQKGTFNIFTHPDEGIWISSQGGLVQLPSELNSPKHEVIRWFQKKGFPRSEFFGVQQSDRGDIWFTHKKGITRQRIKQTKGLEDEPEIFDLYSNLDGFSSPLPKNIIESKDQNIWITTPNDLILFDPLSLTEKPKKLEVQLQKVMLDDAPIFLTENISRWTFVPQNLSLSHHDNYLDFEYSSIEVDRPHKVEYRHKLEGYETEWSGASTKTKISFPNLPHGHFKLLISARIAHGDWGPVTEYPFKIMPPWWATWWAYLLYSLLGVALIYFIYRAQLKRRLEQAEVHRLKELDTVKSELYTNITHEFRTPLTVISGMASQIKDDPDQWLDRGVSMIQGNSKRLLSLVNQMLDLSKLESGKIQLDLQQGDIVAYLRYIAQSIHSFAETKEIQIHFHSEEDEVYMDFDSEKIQKVIVNLLSNAVKFTPPKGNIYIDIETQSQLIDNRSKQATSHLQIKIRDTGAGIPESDLPFIFDRFFQVNPDENQDNSFAGRGSGIGLSLVKELIQLMEGEISVKSKVGRETTFTILLPIKNEARTALTTSVVDRSNIEIVRSEKGKSMPLNLENEIDAPIKSNSRSTILLVEDNPDVVTYIASCLQDIYEIQVGNDGQEGIDIATENIPDLIISDVMMPVKDGFEVCHTLKNDPRTSHIPIIMLTAKADMASKIAGLEKGADAYLSKPFHKKELLVRIEGLLSIREKLQARYRSIMNENSVAIEAQDDSIVIPIESEFIIKAKEIVHRHIDDGEYSVQTFCKEIGMSHSQLHRKMTALIGMSPNRFIRDIRLTKAKQLLKDPTLNINTIAYDTGFKDPGYFSRVFKKEFGMTPAEWREK